MKWGESMYSIFKDTVADMTWLEIEEALQKGAVVLSPTGVIEQQGPHLPTGVDIYESHYICRYIKKRLEKENISSIIAPPYYFGVNHITGAFPGSFTSRKETVQAVLFDMWESLFRWGAKHIFVIDVHGDQQHGDALIGAIRKTRQTLNIDVRSVIANLVANQLGITKDQEEFLIFDIDFSFGSFEPTPSYPDFHAGAQGTARFLKYFPDLVRREKIKELSPKLLKKEEIEQWQEGGDRTKVIVPKGYVGNPQGYTPFLSEDKLDFISGFIEFASRELLHYLRIQSKKRG